MADIVGLDIQIGAKVDSALRAFDNITKSAGTTAASITASMTKATGSISAIAPASQKAASSVNIIGISFDKAAAKVDEISSAIANIPKPKPIVVDVIADTDEAIAAIKNIPTGAINLQATGIPNLSGAAKQLDETTIQATKLDAALENVAASAGSTGAAISIAMGKAAGAIERIPDATIKVDAAISQIPVEATQAATGIDKISTAISQVSSSSVNEFGTVIRGFDSIEASIDQIANDFHAKWNPVFDKILSTTVPIETVSTAFTKLKSNVAAFGGGLLTINTQDVKEVIADVSKLSISVKEIPPITLGLTGSTEIIKIASDVELLVNDLVKLGSGGSASVNQLTQALNILKTAQATTTDTTAFNIYKDAIDKITTSINVLKTNVTTFGGGVLKFDTTGVKDAINDINKLTSIKPAPVKIDIIVSQDIQQSLVGMEHLSEEIRQLATGGVTNISQLTTAVKTLKTASLSATDIGSVAKYNSAIEKLTGQVTKIKGAVIPAGTAIGGVSKSSNAATQSLTDMGRIVQDLPYGFIGISNNLNPALEGLKRLSIQAKESGVSVGSLLLKSLTGAGGLGIALSVVSSALTLATVGFSAWTRGFGGAAKAVDEATKANEDYVKSIEDINDAAIKSSQKEIVSLTTLTSIAQDNAASIGLRVDAVKKLQDQYPAYFGSLTKEQILYGNLTDEINLTTTALLNKAFAEGNLDKAAAAGKRVFDVTEKRRESVAKVLALQKQLDEIGDVSISVGTFSTTQSDAFRKSLLSATDELEEIDNQLHQARLDQATFLEDAKKYSLISEGVAGTGKAFESVGVILRKLGDDFDEINKKAADTGGDFSTDKISAYKKAIADLSKIPIDTGAIKTLTGSMNALLQAGIGKDSEVIRNIQKQIDDLNPAAAAIDKLNGKLKALGGTFGEGKGLKTIGDVLTQLGRDIDFLNAKEVSFGTDEIPNKIKVIESAISKLSDLNVPADSTVIQKLFGDIKDLQFEELGRQLPERLKEGLKIIKPVEIPIPIEPKIEIPPFASAAEAERARLIAQAIAAFKNLDLKVPVNITAQNDIELKAEIIGSEKIIKDLNESFEEIKDVLKLGLAKAVGEGLGAALAGEGFGNLLKGVFSIIGSVVKQMGEKLLIAGLGIKAFKESLKAAFATLQAPIAILGGLALIALGTAIEKQVAKIKTFEEGGIVTQAMLGIIGERGPEAILPLDRLNDFIKPGNEFPEYLPVHRVSGSELLLWYQRSVAQRGRTY